MSHNPSQRSNARPVHVYSSRQHDTTAPVANSGVQQSRTEFSESVPLGIIGTRTSSHRITTTSTGCGDLTTDITDENRDSYYLPRFANDYGRQASDPAIVHGGATERISSNEVIVPDNMAESSPYAEIICNRVRHLLYVAPDFDGAPDPNYRISLEIYKLYTELLKLSEQTDKLAAVKSLDKHVWLAVQSIHRLMPLVKKGKQCHTEIQVVFNFYKAHGESAAASAEDDELMRQKADYIQRELIPSVESAIKDLLKGLDDCQQSIPVEEQRLSTKISKWVTAQSAIVAMAAMVVAANVLAFPPVQDAERATVASYVSAALKSVINVTDRVLALRSSTSESVFERLTKDLKKYTDRLIRHCRVFLGALVELTEVMRPLGRFGAASWDARVEGAIRAYLFGFELDHSELMKLLSMEAYTDIQDRNA